MRDTTTKRGATGRTKKRILSIRINNVNEICPPQRPLVQEQKRTKLPQTSQRPDEL